MRNLFLFFFLSVFLFAFSACSEDDTPLEEPQPVFSYFRGYIDDKYMEIEQGSVMDSRIHLDQVSYIGDSITRCCWHINFAQDFRNYEERKNAPTLSIQLAPLRLSDNYITSDVFDNEAAIEYHSRDNINNITYTPKPDRPFYIYINGIFNMTRLAHDPVIWGTMEGTLYNPEDPKDSIVIHDVEFRRSPVFKIVNPIPELDFYED